MIIKVGSQNPTKIAAVKKILSEHELFNGAEVQGVQPNIEEFGHPKTLADTINGAQERAKQIFADCDYSIGLESGMFTSKEAKSGYFETTMCAIYDGKQFHLGMGPSF